MIRLTSENIKLHNPKEPVAIYVQDNGRRWRACVFENDRNIYYINTIKDGISLQEIQKIYPVLNECYSLGTLKGDMIPEGWSALYMGNGKNLLLKMDVYTKIVNNIGEMSAVEAYKHGKEILLSVL